MPDQIVASGGDGPLHDPQRSGPSTRGALGASSSALRPGVLRTAILAAALALAPVDPAYAQQIPGTAPRPGPSLAVGRDGAPPELSAVVRVDQQTPPARTDVVFEFARQPLRAGGGRSRGASWSVALRIGDDGSWTTPGRSGRLSPPQMAELRAAIARTSLAAEPVTLEVPLQGTRTERVTIGARSVSWSAPGYFGLPNRGLRHLIELAYRLTRSRS